MIDDVFDRDHTTARYDAISRDFRLCTHTHTRVVRLNDISWNVVWMSTTRAKQKLYFHFLRWMKPTWESITRESVKSNMAVTQNPPLWRHQSDNIVGGDVQGMYNITRPHVGLRFIPIQLNWCNLNCLKYICWRQHQLIRSLLWEQISCWVEGCIRTVRSVTSWFG